MNSPYRVLGCSGAPATREFDQDRVVLGREADCDVVVDDARVSRHHLVFFRDGDVWVVSDASSNGSFVHGQRIQQFAVPPVSTVLNLGDPNGQPVTVWMVPAQVAAPASAGPGAAAARRRRARPSRGAPSPSARCRRPARACAQQVLPPGSSPTATPILPRRPQPGRLARDRPRADQRGGADRPAGVAVPRPAGPGSGAGAPRPRQLQRHVRQRPAGPGLGRARARVRGHLRQPDLPLGRVTAGRVGHEGRVHAVRRRADHDGRRRQDPARQRVVPARAVEPDRRDRPVGRRQVHAARRPHRPPRRPRTAG